MTYEKIHWESLEIIKSHLYRRLADPIKSIDEFLENMPKTEARLMRKLTTAQQTNKALLNTVNAWATLVYYKSQGPLTEFQRKPLSRTEIPNWFIAYFDQQATFRMDFDSVVYVHHETFFESILLLFHVAKSLSKIDYIELVDSPVAKGPGVYMRIVFEPKDDVGVFSSLKDVTNKFDSDKLEERDLMIQFMVARDMLALNNIRFRLQNNRKIKKQAFSAFVEIEVPQAPPVILEEPEPTIPIIPNAEKVKVENTSLEPSDTDKLRILTPTSTNKNGTKKPRILKKPEAKSEPVGDEKKQDTHTASSEKSRSTFSW